MTPEGKVKEKIKRWLDEHMPGHWRVMPQGTIFGKAGCPDILICWHGLFIAIEVKSDVGQLTALQVLALNKIKNAGGIAAVVKGFDLNRLNAIKLAAMQRMVVKSAEPLTVKVWMDESRDIESNSRDNAG